MNTDSSELFGLRIVSKSRDVLKVTHDVEPGFSLQKRDRESVFSYPGRFFGWTASWAKRLEGFSGPWPSVKRGRSLAAGCKLLGSVLIGVQVDKRLDFMNMKPWILGLSPLHGPETRLRGNQFHKKFAD
ncbi:hypothetical protein TWF703_009356 [Orbilia oligospora]|uniref:Uncharacterized protein n=1 Tax=Orbilia oligospora TaxID=2813651 RepID=A0A7C8NX23_ORBOL|nr:hypothetical protein TWF703_009356 [Orbilia oligospora]